MSEFIKISHKFEIVKLIAKIIDGKLTIFKLPFFGEAKNFNLTQLVRLLSRLILMSLIV